MSKNHSNYLVTELRRFCSAEDPLITTLPQAHSLIQCDAGNFLLKTVAKYLYGWRAPLKVTHGRKWSALFAVCETLRMDGGVPISKKRVGVLLLWSGEGGGLGSGGVGQRQAGGAAEQSRTPSLGWSGHLFSGSPSGAGAGAGVLLSRYHCSWQWRELPALNSSLGALHPTLKPIPLLRILKSLL